MGAVSGDKVFLSPSQVRRRFNISKAEYNRYVEMGLPTYMCAGVIRHPIEEIYMWCESHRIVLQDQNDLCTRTQIKKLLGITDKDLIAWELAGLPKITTYNERLGNLVYKYNKNDIIDWLKSQQNATVEV